MVFEYYIDYLNLLFTEDEASFKGVQYNMLVNAVVTADFSDILPVWIANRRKTYVGGILRFISKGILKSEQKEWLAAASESIGISKYAGGTRVNEAYDLWRYKLTNKIKHSIETKNIRSSIELLIFFIHIKAIRRISNPVKNPQKSRFFTQKIPQKFLSKF